MLKFDGVFETPTDLVFYRVVAKLPLVRNIVEQEQSSNPVSNRRDLRWKDGSYLAKPTQDEEKYLKRMNIA